MKKNASIVGTKTLNFPAAKAAQEVLLSLCQKHIEKLKNRVWFCLFEKLSSFRFRFLYVSIELPLFDKSLGYLVFLFWDALICIKFLGTFEMLQSRKCNNLVKKKWDEILDIVTICVISCWQRSFTSHSLPNAENVHKIFP